MNDHLVDFGLRTIAPGLVVGPLAFGCWRFIHKDASKARRVLDAAIESGMTLVDTADVYGLDFGGPGFGAAEDLLGRVLAESPDLRNKIQLATKGGIRPGVPYDSSAGALRAACEDSLRRLRVDVIDLYQIHRPDLFCHPAELAEILSRLMQEGKVRQVGCSNFTVSQFETLQAYLPGKLVVHQFEFSVFTLDPLWNGTFDSCLKNHVTPLAWSPLAGGRILSAIGVSPEAIAVLDELSIRESCSRAQVALAFVLAHPSKPIAIVGTQNEEHLRVSVKAKSVRLTRRDCYRLIEASRRERLP